MSSSVNSVGINRLVVDGHTDPPPPAVRSGEIVSHAGTGRRSISFLLSPAADFAKVWIGNALGVPTHFVQLGEDVTVSSQIQFVGNPPRTEQGEYLGDQITVNHEVWFGSHSHASLET